MEKRFRKWAMDMLTIAEFYGVQILFGLPVDPSLETLIKMMMFCALLFAAAETIKAR